MQGRTELDVKRYTPLAKEQAATQQDLDNAVQNNLAAIASVETAKAQIKTSQAAVETAKIISNSRGSWRRSMASRDRHNSRSARSLARQRGRNLCFDS